MNKQGGLQINQYCYQGLMKRQDGFNINHAILLSGLYEKQGWVADKKAEMRLRSGKLLKMQGLIDIP